MEGPVDGRWSAVVPGAAPGSQYAFIVEGPWDPAAGHRFDPSLTLLDPRTPAVAGMRAWCGIAHPSCNGQGPGTFPSGAADLELTFDSRPRCVLVDGRFDWDGDRAPRIPAPDLVIYEAHVRGLTMHPSAPTNRHGTFMGVIDAIPHLTRLGVNAIELMPVAEAVTDGRLRGLGLVNYWGYDTIAPFAPAERFALGTDPGCQVREFKAMVREAHRSGIEVILDVVFNHTGEQGHTLCLRGIDNATYYRLDVRDRSRYDDWTGCGNTLDFTRPEVVAIAIDCLRYWVLEMHVDGFRFDLAPVLCRRGDGTFDRRAPFLEAVRLDPVLSGVRLVAEPWDLCPNSPVQSGSFPKGWSEWNGRFRDNVRGFVRGDSWLASGMGWRLTGSADLHYMQDSTPCRSVNFVTCHDGFTLYDLVSYNAKHNDANGEAGRDGESNNLSSNSGFEGPTDDPVVVAMRARRARNLEAILLLSRGVPMILMGDEILRTQGGNNNSYCQDSSVAWMDWTLTPVKEAFLRFVRILISLRRSHPVLRDDRFASGVDGDCDSVRDVEWYGSLEDLGGRVGPPQWDDPSTRALALRMDGSESPHPDGRPDDDFILVLNSWEVTRSFPLPELTDGTVWHVVLDTARPTGREIREPGTEEPVPAGATRIEAHPHSVMLLQAIRPAEALRP